MVMSVLVLLMKTPHCEMCHQTTDFCTHASGSTSKYHSKICSKTQVFVITFATRMGLCAKDLFAIEKMATAGMGKKVATTLGLLHSTTKRWLQTALGGRNGVAQHWATTWCGGWCVSLHAFFVSHLSNCARFVRLFSGSDDKITGACSCQDADQRLGCHRAVLFCRQCSQTSGIERGRSSVQQYMKSEHWDFFLWNELDTQLVQYPAPANPAELLALLTRVYQRTSTGSCWMFEKMIAAWVRTLKACVAAKGGFSRVEQRWQTASYRSKTQRKKTRHLTRHLTLCCITRRHRQHNRCRQHLPSRNGPADSLMALKAVLSFPIP